METKKKTKSKTTPKPVKTFRQGVLAAHVWKRQSQTGYSFFEFSISRYYKSQNGDKEGYSSNYFARNQSAIVEVVQQASAWIENQNPDDITADAA